MLDRGEGHLRDNNYNLGGHPLLIEGGGCVWGEFVGIDLLQSNFSIFIKILWKFPHNPTRDVYHQKPLTGFRICL